jgi:membrane-bound ClpP family serine protease
VVSPRKAYRRLQARRSTLFAVLGIVLIALGVILTLTRAVGDVVPTVLALAGLVSLVVGIATGSLLVFENFRYSRNQSYYDADEDEDQ